MTAHPAEMQTDKDKGQKQKGGRQDLKGLGAWCVVVGGGCILGRPILLFMPSPLSFLPRHVTSQHVMRFGLRLRGRRLPPEAALFLLSHRLMSA